MQRVQFLKFIGAGIAALFVPSKKMASPRFPVSLVEYYDNLLSRSNKGLAECAACCGVGIYHLGKLHTVDSEGNMIQDGKRVIFLQDVPEFVRKTLAKGA